MKKYLFFLSFISFLMSGCEQEADIPLPKVDPVVSVSCFISDETDTLKVSLVWSDPVFSSDPKEGQLVTDANVVFYGNSISVHLSFNEQSGLYEYPLGEASLQPGMTYHLDVQTSDGTKVSASTQIPLELPDIRSTSLTREVSLDQYNQYVVRFQFETLLGNVNNDSPYYRILYYQKWDDPMISYQSYQTGELLHEFDSGDTEKNLKMEVVNYGMDTTFTLHESYVIHCSEDYYRFHKTIQSINYGPFAEPSIVYTNIENGLGIFAGFRQLKIVY